MCIVCQQSLFCSKIRGEEQKNSANEQNIRGANGEAALIGSEDERKETSALLAARSFAFHPSNIVPVLSGFTFFPADFRGKERRFTVYFMYKT